jgi:hypothetical protein
LTACPGTWNHGIGIALDLNTNYGKQTRSRPNYTGSRLYQWLYKNAHKFGFTSTVRSKPWHWEFCVVAVGRASFSYNTVQHNLIYGLINKFWSEKPLYNKKFEWIFRKEVLGFNVDSIKQLEYELRVHKKNVSIKWKKEARQRYSWR